MNGEEGRFYGKVIRDFVVCLLAVIENFNYHSWIKVFQTTINVYCMNTTASAELRSKLYNVFSEYDYILKRKMNYIYMNELTLRCREHCLLMLTWAHLTD